MVCAPLAQMPEDLQTVAVVRTELFGWPEHAHLARPFALLLARTAVPLEIPAQILEKAGITHFDSHAVSHYRKRTQTDISPFYATASRTLSGMSKFA